jgi:hypothetical protein
LLSCLTPNVRNSRYRSLILFSRVIFVTYNSYILERFSRILFSCDSIIMRCMVGILPVCQCAPRSLAGTCLGLWLSRDFTQHWMETRVHIAQTILQTLYRECLLEDLTFLLLDQLVVTGWIKEYPDVLSLFFSLPFAFDIVTFIYKIELL